ncbi:SMC-Scp complex subunit ScpB [Psychrobacter piscatorii]|uniref:Segregation and condensation protein B n=1 Tax=Psychrobacter piscatorii TaxID=554343 RepID=A0A0T6DMW1_9GAMM|nr:SMC-Scp complex subunit ScpB [Psychrobacter piscatorii]KRU21311.1 segregation and condensation protein B [Psychrobacter piscatorii]
MVDIDDSKQPSEAETTDTATAASIGANQASLEEVSKHIEVLLHASEAPLTAQALRKYLSLSSKALKQALDVLERRLETGVLNLHETASGYRLQISDDYSGLIQQTFPQRQERLSQALLETLSIIAYKQPVTRSDIEQVRGVTLSSNILRQLFDKGWIIEKGFKETLGRPALLHTTAQFLDAFGLSHLDELPPMPDMDSIRAMS